MRAFDESRWLLAYSYKCPLTNVDNLTLNDFYGSYKVLQEIREAEKGNTENKPKSIVRPATEKELAFVERYKKSKEK